MLNKSALLCASSDIPIEVLDNTVRSCGASCLRNYYLRHRRCYESIFGSTALRYGSVWHAVQDAFYTGIGDNGWSYFPTALEEAIRVGKYAWEEETARKQFREDYRTLTNLIKSFMSYLSYHQSDSVEMEVLTSEEAFVVDMSPYVHLRAGVKPFFFGGIMDLKVKLMGQIWFIDHKTTGASLDQQVFRLQRSAQFIGYTFGLGAKQETDVTGFQISFHYLSARKRKDGQYGEPSIDFRRSPEIYGEEDLRQWLTSILETAERIQRAEETNIWPMQFDSCYNYGSCTYIDICTGIEPDRPVLDPSYVPNNFIVGEKWDVFKEVRKKKLLRQKALNIPME